MFETQQHPLKRACIDKINEGLIKAERVYNRKFEFPAIDFNLTGTTAGKAYCGLNKITLNWILLKENGEKFVNRTPVHELAHLVSVLVYGVEGKGHGERWKNVARALGTSPERCHSYDTTNARTRGAYKYKCSCKEYVFSTVRHNRAMSGAKYSCKKCGYVLTPSSGGAIQLTTRTAAPGATLF